MGGAGVEHRRYRRMKRPVNGGDAGQLVFGAQILIAGNARRLAHLGHGAGRFRRPVAIIDEARITLQHQRRIDEPRQEPGDTLGADIPGDVAGKLALRQAETAELARHAVSGMLADQHIG
jgi:hypothetical protein